MVNPQVFDDITAGELRSVNEHNENKAAALLATWLGNHIGIRRSDLPLRRPSDVIKPVVRVYMLALAKMVADKADTDKVSIFAVYGQGSVRFGIGKNDSDEAARTVSSDVEARVTALISAVVGVDHEAEVANTMSVNELRQFLSNNNSKRVRILSFSRKEVIEEVISSLVTYGGLVSGPISDRADSIISGRACSVQFTATGFGKSVSIGVSTEDTSARINVCKDEFIIVEMGGEVAMKLMVSGVPVPLSNQSLTVLG